MANFSQNQYVKKAFWGIRPAVTALIASAVISIAKASLLIQTDTGYTPAIGSIIVCVVAFGLMQIKKLPKFHPGIWILAAAAVGVIFRL